ncbi:MAG TPA: hypothetical protein VIQ24_18720 [Pyrinomonadaceae bacterium]
MSYKVAFERRAGESFLSAATGSFKQAATYREGAWQMAGQGEEREPSAGGGQAGENRGGAAGAGGGGHEGEPEAEQESAAAMDAEVPQPPDASETTEGQPS